MKGISLSRRFPTWILWSLKNLRSKDLFLHHQIHAAIMKRNFKNFLHSFFVSAFSNLNLAILPATSFDSWWLNLSNEVIWRIIGTNRQQQEGKSRTMLEIHSAFTRTPQILRTWSFVQDRSPRFKSDDTNDPIISLRTNYTIESDSLPVFRIEMSACNRGNVWRGHRVNWSGRKYSITTFYRSRARAEIKVILGITWKGQCVVCILRGSKRGGRVM